MGPIWSMWMKAWTWTDSFAAEFESSEMVIDTELYNDHMIFHCVFQSLPHLILHLLNGILLRGNWGWFSFISIGASAYLTLAGGYTFLVYRYSGCLGNRVYALKDVPQILSFIGSKALALPVASNINSRPFFGDHPILIELGGYSKVSDAPVASDEEENGGEGRDGLSAGGGFEPVGGSLEEYKGDSGTKYFPSEILVSSIVSADSSLVSKSTINPVILRTPASIVEEYKAVQNESRTATDQAETVELPVANRDA